METLSRRERQILDVLYNRGKGHAAGIPSTLCRILPATRPFDLAAVLEDKVT